VDTGAECIQKSSYLSSFLFRFWNHESHQNHDSQAVSSHI
jgi:hypothetical protein